MHREGEAVVERGVGDGDDELADLLLHACADSGSADIRGYPCGCGTVRWVRSGARVCNASMILSPEAPLPRRRIERAQGVLYCGSGDAPGSAGTPCNLVRSLSLSLPSPSPSSRSSLRLAHIRLRRWSSLLKMLSPELQKYERMQRRTRRAQRKERVTRVKRGFVVARENERGGSAREKKKPAQRRKHALFVGDEPGLAEGGDVLRLEVPKGHLGAPRESDEGRTPGKSVGFGQPARDGCEAGTAGGGLSVHAVRDLEGVCPRPSVSCQRAWYVTRGHWTVPSSCVPTGIAAAEFPGLRARKSGGIGKGIP